jgi:predicted amidophosphoribosyltransferase
MGELLYRLKYNTDHTAVGGIVDAVETLLSRWRPAIDVLVPVPPSSARSVQPVMVLAEAICRRMGVPMVDCVRKARNAPQLKNVFDLDERSKLLEGLHLVDEGAVKGKGVLLFDDLYRSGATMNSIAGELHDRGGATDIFALTITRTRSNQ